MNPTFPDKRVRRFPLTLMRSPRTRKALLFAVMLVGLLRGLPSLTAVVRAQTTDLSQLPISFPVQAPEVAAYFNEIARPGDSASIPPERLFLLSQSIEDHRMVAFRSWADAESQLDTLAESAGWIMYNPEHWDLTPEEEQQALVATVQQFAAAAHERGMRFMFAPDRQYAELYLNQVAPDVDAVMLQGQRLQHDPQTFATWILGMAEVAHSSNPDVQVFVQVGATRGTASEMYAALETVAGGIDGIAVWSMPRTLEVLQEFVTLVRGSVPAAPPTAEPAVTPSATPTSTATAPAPTAGPTEQPPSPPPTATLAAVASSTSSSEEAEVESTPSPVATATSLPPAGPGPAMPVGGWVTGVLLFVGGTGVGLVLGFLLGWGLRRGA
jgi:hypothetical protein